MSAVWPLCSTSLHQEWHKRTDNVSINWTATYYRLQWVVGYTGDHIRMAGEFVKWRGAANVINVGLYGRVHGWRGKRRMHG